MPIGFEGMESDAGTFKAAILVEDQPCPIKPETHWVPAGLLLVGGTAMLLSGFWSLGRLRIPIRQPDLRRDLPLFGQLVLTFLVTLALIALGRCLLRHAQRLYAGLRSHSKLFLLQFEGTFSRA